MVEKLIVFGDDGSGGAGAAWGWLEAQDWGGWPVDVVTASNTEFHPHEAGEELVHEWEPSAPRHALATSGLGPVRHLVGNGDPRLLLASIAQHGLLVIGARGVGGFEGLLVGSTADWLMRDPPVPIVMVRRAEPVRSVALFVDGSHHADAAVRAFSELPWAASTQCTVVGVADTAEGPRAACEAAASVLRKAGCQVATEVIELDDMAVTLNPAPRILDYLDRVDPDLVVMGTQGRTGFARLWFGSVAGAVAHHSTCNVMMARA